MYKKGQLISILIDRSFTFWEPGEGIRHEDVNSGSFGEFVREDEEFVYVRFGEDVFWFYGTEVEAANFPHMTIFRLLDWLDSNILKHRFHSLCRFLTSGFFEKKE